MYIHIHTLYIHIHIPQSSSLAMAIDSAVLVYMCGITIDLSPKGADGFEITPSFRTGRKKSYGNSIMIAPATLSEDKTHTV